MGAGENGRSGHQTLDVLKSFLTPFSQPTAVQRPAKAVSPTQMYVQRNASSGLLHSMTVPMASNADAHLSEPHNRENHPLLTFLNPELGKGSPARRQELPAVNPSLSTLLSQGILHSSVPSLISQLNSNVATSCSPPSSASSTRSGGSSAGNENSAQQGNMSAVDPTRINSCRPVRSQRTPMKEITTLGSA